MSWISWICFGICFTIIISIFQRGADPLSPARTFGFIWSLCIGLAELKLSSLQHDWNLYSWTLLLIAVVSFLVGTYIAYVLNIRSKLVPIEGMRQILKAERIHESRLFWLICVSVLVYIISYTINFSLKGWLPISAAARNMSRVEFNVTGLTFLIYIVPSVFYLMIIYTLKVEGKRGKKAILFLIFLIVLGSFLLFVSRFQIVIVFVIGGTLLYYGTRYIRLRTGLLFFTILLAFFYWISSMRYSHLAATFLYSISKMNISRDYALLTEPYMYFVMNLENFARAVNHLDYHTYGYFTFDFITAISGLKYWIYEYFNLERLPYLISGYNTYSAFWIFYFDFGVLGLAIIPWLFGFSSSMVYYRMRSRPSIRNVTAYGVLLFVNIFTFFVFPISFLWFEFNILVLYFFLRWTVIPRKESLNYSPEQLCAAF